MHGDMTDASFNAKTFHYPLIINFPYAKMESFVIFVCLTMVVSPPKPIFSLSIKSKLNPRIVETRNGKIQGVVLTIQEHSKYLLPIDAYLGIPYATPPTMSNRFSPTRAPSPWDGVKLTDSYGPVCPQKLPDITNEEEALKRMPKGRYEYLKRLLPHLQNQSEDCLYLNVYGPAMGDPETWFIADSRDPQQRWLMTPITHALPDIPEGRLAVGHSFNDNETAGGSNDVAIVDGTLSREFFKM